MAGRYPADLSRVYLTGLSMGGFAVWKLAAEYPRRFAAIAPVCASAQEERLHLLREVPVWAFHGALDEIVPAVEIQKHIALLRGCGGNA